MRQSVMVIGGGVAGLSAANTLAESGHPVILVDREPRIGGRANNYSCKATDTCHQCNVCLALQAKREIDKHSIISIYTDTEVDALQGRAGDYTVTATRKPVHWSDGECLRCGLCARLCPEGSSGRNPVLEGDTCEKLSDGTCEICALQCPAGAIDPAPRPETMTFAVGAVIAATGFEPFNARAEARYGYGEDPGVVTGADVEEAFRGREPLAGYLDGRRKIAFIQCVGSRDTDGSGYCSRACCGYALSLARMIKHDVEDSDITVYYMDIQGFGRDTGQLRRDCEEAGIKFVRARPAGVRPAAGGHGVEVTYEDVSDGVQKREPFDMAVLSVGMAPGGDADGISDVLGINVDEHGFFAGRYGGPRDDVTTNVPGLFVAGTCGGPRDIAGSVAHARKAAAAAARLLKGRSTCEIT